MPTVRRESRAGMVVGNSFLLSVGFSSSPRFSNTGEAKYHGLVGAGIALYYLP